MGHSDVYKCLAKQDKAACKRHDARTKAGEKRKENSLKRNGFVQAGVIGMDTASILLSDPGYVLHQKHNGDFGSNYDDFIMKASPNNFARGSKQLKYPLGHAGLGVVLYTGGDGDAKVFTKHRGGVLVEARIVF